MEDFYEAVRESGLEAQLLDGFGWYYNASATIAAAINAASRDNNVSSGGSSYNSSGPSPTVITSSPYHKLAVSPTASKPLVSLRGFARAAFEVQHAENPYIRLASKLPDDESGVIIRYTSNVSNIKGVSLIGAVYIEVWVIIIIIIYNHTYKLLLISRVS